MKIILVGKMGAGKNTVADYLTEKYQFIQLAFADKLKNIAKTLFPDAFKNVKPRKLLQDLGAKMREIDEDCWVNYLIREVDLETSLYAGKNIVITDCRYKNELEIAQVNGFVPVRIIIDDEQRHARLVLRDKVINKDTFNHISETDLDGIYIEYELENNGSVTDLHKSIDLLISDLGAKQ